MSSDRSFILGIFTSEHPLFEVAKELKEKSIPIHDIYTPFPVHGLDAVMEFERSRLPYVTFIAGFCGLVFAVGFQYWVSAVSWPIIVGGKPFNSLPAFIPVTFEITVLLGAFITVFAFFLRSKLFPGKEACILDLRASSDRFVVAIEKKDWSVDVETLRALFQRHGASEVVVKEVSA